MSATERSMHMAIKNVVLVHGAFADGSGWSNVIAEAALAAVPR